MHGVVCVVCKFIDVVESSRVGGSVVRGSAQPSKGPRLFSIDLAKIWRATRTMTSPWSVP